MRVRVMVLRELGGDDDGIEEEDFVINESEIRS
jgi:hypothetical protein